MTLKEQKGAPTAATVQSSGIQPTHQSSDCVISVAQPQWACNRFRAFDPQHMGVPPSERHYLVDWVIDAERELTSSEEEALRDHLKWKDRELTLGPSASIKEVL